MRRKIKWLELKAAGDCGVWAGCGNEISEEVNGRVAALNAAVISGHIRGVRETVPSFASLLVIFDPLVTDSRKVMKKIRGLAEGLSEIGEDTGRLVEIPVCYGGDLGPDLKDVAEYAGLTEEETIKIHCSTDYRIYMLGFLPGFPYLGGLDARICCPRLESPRTKIPAGAVGIGGSQTGIYPMDSPGGWRLIGRTPLKLYDPEKCLELPYRQGDRIRFKAISEEEYRAIAQREGTL